MAAKLKQWTKETPPIWFDIDAYTYLRKLNVEGWYNVINSYAYKEKWGYNIADTLAELWDIPREEIKPDHLMVIPVKEIDEHGELHAKKLANPLHYITLCCDLTVSDAILMKEIGRLITEKRKVRGILKPALRKGRSAKGNLNTHFIVTHFQPWLSYQIIPLKELELKGAAEGNEFSNKQLGEWLFKNYGRPEQEVSKARIEWRKAVKSLPALQAQIKYIQ